MGRGFFAGIFWGLVVAAVGLWGLSQLGGDRSVLPAPTEVTQSAPSGTEGQVQVTEDTAVEPDTDTSADPPPVTTQALAPADVSREVLPQADTADLERPQTGQVNDLAAAPDAQSGTAPALESDAVTLSDAVRPALPANEDAVPQTPDAPPTPAGDDAVADAPTPAQADDVAQLPEVGDAQPTTEQVAKAPVPAESDTAPNVDFSNPTEVDTPQEPAAAPDAETGDEAADVASSADDTQPAPVVVNRLPVVGSDEAAETPAPAPEPAQADTADATGSETDEAEDAFPPGTPALVRYARPFDDTDQPLIAIILITDASGELGTTGAALPFPVTYAIDGSSFAAKTLMEAARAQDQEVVALAPLPATVAPEDVATSFEVYLKRVDQSVAVMDEIQASFQASREVAEAVAYQADLDGRGIITYPRGLNSGVQVAEREGVPVTLVFREYDSAGQDRAAMKRFLDQAAFRAGQESGVIMVGHDRPETIAALLEWRLGTRAKTVALAPVSAVLRGK